MDNRTIYGHNTCHILHTVVFAKACKTISAQISPRQLCLLKHLRENFGLGILLYFQCKLFKKTIQFSIPNFVFNYISKVDLFLFCFPFSKLVTIYPKKMFSSNNLILFTKFRREKCFCVQPYCLVGG